MLLKDSLSVLLTIAEQKHCPDHLMCVCLAGGGYKKSYKSSYFCFFKLDFLILKDWKLSTNPEGLQDKNLSLVYDLWSARQCKKCDLLIINIPGLISPIVP